MENLHPSGDQADLPRRAPGHAESDSSYSNMSFHSVREKTEHNENQPSANPVGHELAVHAQSSNPDQSENNAMSLRRNRDSPPSVGKSIREITVYENREIRSETARTRTASAVTTTRLVELFDENAGVPQMGARRNHRTRSGSATRRIGVSRSPKRERGSRPSSGSRASDEADTGIRGNRRESASGSGDIVVYGKAERRIARRQPQMYSLSDASESCHASGSVSSGPRSRLNTGLEWADDDKSEHSSAVSAGTRGSSPFPKIRNLFTDPPLSVRDDEVRAALVLRHTRATQSQNE